MLKTVICDLILLLQKIFFEKIIQILSLCFYNCRDFKVYDLLILSYFLSLVSTVIKKFQTVLTLCMAINLQINKFSKMWKILYSKSNNKTNCVFNF